MSSGEPLGFDFTSSEELLQERPEEQDGLLAGAVRRGKRYALRGAESLAGLPGDLVQLIKR